METFIVLSIDKRSTVHGLLLDKGHLPYVTNNISDAVGIFTLEENHIRSKHPLSNSLNGNSISCVIIKVTERKDVSIIKCSDVYDYE